MWSKISAWFNRRRKKADGKEVSASAEPNPILDAANAFARQEIKSDVDAFVSQGLNTPDETISSLVQAWASDGLRFWHAAYTKVTVRITHVVGQLNDAARKLDSERSRVLTKIAGFNTEIRHSLKVLCLQRLEEEGKNRDRVEHLKRRVRELRCLMFGDPNNEPPKQNWIVGASPAIVATIVSVGLEFLLVFGIFQSASNRHEAAGLSIAIAIAGVILAVVAARTTNALGQYKNAVHRRNQLCNHPHGQLETDVVDRMDGFTMSVEAPKSGTLVLSIAAHLALAVLGGWVLYTRVHILLEQLPNASAGQLFTKSLGAGLVIILWVALYLVERALLVHFHHPLLREYHEAMDELEARETPDADDDLSSFDNKVANVIFRYNGACASAKEPLTSLAEELGGYQESIRILLAYAQGSTELFRRAFHSLLVRGFPALVAKDSELETHPAMDLANGQLRNDYLKQLIERRPVLSQDIATMIEDAVKIDKRPVPLGEITEFNAMLAEVTEEAKAELVSQTAKPTSDPAAAARFAARVGGGV